MLVLTHVTTTRGFGERRRTFRPGGRRAFHRSGRRPRQASRVTRMAGPRTAGLHTQRRLVL